MADESEPIKPMVHPIFEVGTVAGEKFIAVRNHDGTDGVKWHVVSEHGLNYGAWQAVETFRRARLEAVRLKDGETTDKLTATPLGSARLSIRAF